MVPIRSGVAVLVLAAATAPAFAQNTAVGLRLGTLGVGAEITIPLARSFLIRAGASTLPIEIDDSYSDLDYTIDLPSVFGTFGIDLIVTETAGLRIGAGALLLTRSVEIIAEPTGPVEIGNGTYPAESVERLVGNLSHGTIAPYLLLGVGHPLARGIGFYFDAGAVFLSEPSFNFRYTGPLQFNNEFTADLARERLEVEREVRDLPRVLPLISIGIRVFAG